MIIGNVEVVSGTSDKFMFAVATVCCLCFLMFTSGFFISEPLAKRFMFLIDVEVPPFCKFWHRTSNFEVSVTRTGRV